MDKPSRIRGSMANDNDMALATKASKAAFRKLIEERRRTGGTIVIWREGKVQHIPASEVAIPEEEK